MARPVKRSGDAVEAVIEITVLAIQLVVWGLLALVWIVTTLTALVRSTARRIADDDPYFFAPNDDADSTGGRTDGWGRY